MIDFKGVIKINEETSYVYTFFFPVNSSITKNDGCIGYGRTISDITVTAYTQDGTDVTSALISGSPTVSANIVYIKYKYPTGFSTGRYYVYIDITLDNGEKDRGYFGNVMVE